MSSTNQGTRLNKYLASCGVGSRRSCDALIQEGRVYVNNACCTNMGTRVTADDVVRLGKKVVTPRASEVVLFNKPRGLVCSASDELGRETIYSILPPKYQHLKNVGGLDMDSEGVIVLTNDGDLALKLTHPRQKIEKEYLVTLDQSFSNEVLERLVSGVHTPEGRASAKSIKRVSSRRVKVVLVTGMKRQIRLMFDAVHLKVTKLVRIRIGLLTGGGLELGKCRDLDEEEVQDLQTNPKGGRHDSAPSSDPSPRPAKKSARRPAQKSGPQLSFKMPAKKQPGKKRK
jgi:23S rRNA pseudouridine2605 synthase